jgi:ubiquinone/menaquinone biosynthesis C-methylase UbiE
MKQQHDETGNEQPINQSPGQAHPEIPDVGQSAVQDKHPFDYWLKRNRYYHQRVINFYKTQIPEGASVLMLNCKNGYLLHALKPFFGLGIDTDERALASARAQYPEYHFVSGSLDALQIFHRFDYIIVPFVTMETDDIQEFFTQLHRFCHPGTRIIVETYNLGWKPILWLTQKLGMRRSTSFKHWISQYDVHNFLHLSGFDVVTSGSSMMMPTYVPLVSSAFNTVVAQVPIINKLSLVKWTVARPVRAAKNRLEATVSVIITCRNEAGNIENAVTRTPIMGKETELIFVEGGSKDNTREEIERMLKKYPHKNMRLLIQDGTGKGDAVRKGFANARGDVLMILDGDLTVVPEDLPKFFDALMSGKGEFINGSRLVCGMEKGAMPWLNWVVNYSFGMLTSWIMGQRIKDSLCGTKVLFKKDYERIAKDRPFFSLNDPYGDFDLIFGAARLNLKIVDQPVHYKQRTYGHTNIQHFRGGVRLLLMCWHALRKLKLK